jgi:MFS family permease
MQEVRGRMSQIWQHNIKYNNYHGVAQSLADNTFKPFLGIFALALGASNLEVAMLNSLPAVISVFAMLPGTKMINRSTNTKRLTAILFFAYRTFFLVIAGVPFLPQPLRSVSLVIAVGLMNLPAAVGTVAWQSLIGKLIPSDLRSQAFAQRNKLTGVVGLIPTLITGFLLDYLPSPLGYQIMFVIAFIFALAEIYLLLQLADVDGEEQYSSTPEKDLCSLRDIVNEKKFFRYMASSLVFYFGWQMAWPLFTLYQVKNLGANNTWIGFFSAIITLVSILSYHWWGKYAGDKGNYKALILATFGMAITPIFTALSPNLWVLAATNLIAGFFTAGTVLILFNAMLDTAPDCIRTSCVAYYNTMINISATIAPFVGSLIMDISNIYVALMVSALLRGLGCVAFYIAQRRQEIDIQ